jgi:hypothetical protein
MKRLHGWIFLLAIIALCTIGAWFTLRITAEYPSLGEPVSYSVNQVDGFELTIEKPSWSIFSGYTIDWSVTADSEEVYYFYGEAPGFEFLERCVEGQWYRLGYVQDNLVFNSLEFSMGGGDNTELQGSIVQKYNYYGTRLEAGTYRVVLEMKEKDRTPYYLTAEFEVE